MSGQIDPTVDPQTFEEVELYVDEIEVVRAEIVREEVDGPARLKALRSSNKTIMKSLVDREAALVAACQRYADQHRGGRKTIKLSRGRKLKWYIHWSLEMYHKPRTIVRALKRAKKYRYITTTVIEVPDKRAILQRLRSSRNTLKGVRGFRAKATERFAVYIPKELE